MIPPAHSRAYKLAKWQLARPPQKHAIAICLVVSLFFPGIVRGVVWSGALKLSADSADMMSSAVSYGGGMMLCAAYCAWLLKGYRQIIEEQAKIIEEARAKQNA